MTAPQRRRIISKEQVVVVTQAKRKAKLGVIPILPASFNPHAGENAGDYGSDALRTIARYKSKVHNPLTAIRAKCIECSGGSVQEVGECTLVKCALHPFRMGKNPFHARSSNQRAAAAEEGGSDDDSDDQSGA